MFKEKTPSVIAMFHGLTRVTKFEDFLTDPDKGIEFAAIYLADDATLKKFRTDPTALLPYILQVEEMPSGEVAKIISFFSGELTVFSRAITPKDPAKATKETITRTEKKTSL